MQATQTKSENLTRHFEVMVPATEIEGYLTKRVAELTKTVRMQGFRPGKVPHSLIIKRYGQSLIGEVLDKVISETSSGIISEHGLKPALQPTVQITSYIQGGDLKYNLLLEILPEIKPLSIDGKTLKKYVVKVTPEKLKEDLLELLQDFKNTEVITKARAVKAGDTVTIDFDGKIAKGAKIPGGAGKNYRLKIGSNTFIPGFEDQIIGAKIAEKIKVTVPFPKDYHEKTLAGKNAEFDVVVHEIREDVPLELNDTLAKNLGFPGIEELNKSIQSRLEDQYADLSRTRLKRSLLDLLSDMHTFAIPQGMVQMEFKNIWDQFLEETRKDTSRKSPELTPAEEKKFKAEYEKIAERRVKLGLLISEIGKEANVIVNASEINQSLSQIAKNFPGKEREVMNFYRRHPDALAGVRAPIFEEKVVDYLLSKIKVTEEEVTEEVLLEELNDMTPWEEAGAEDVATEETKMKKVAKAKKA